MDHSKYICPKSFYVSLHTFYGFCCNIKSNQIDLGSYIKSSSVKHFLLPNHNTKPSPRSRYHCTDSLGHLPNHRYHHDRFLKIYLERNQINFWILHLYSNRWQPKIVPTNHQRKSYTPPPYIFKLKFISVTTFWIWRCMINRKNYCGDDENWLLPSAGQSQWYITLLHKFLPVILCDAILLFLHLTQYFSIDHDSSHMILDFPVVPFK